MPSIRPSSARIGTIVNLQPNPTALSLRRPGTARMSPWPIAALPGFHHPVEPGPVPGPLRLRGDEVERLAQGFRGSVAEQALGTRVPKADHALAVGIDDGVGHRLRAPRGPGDQAAPWTGSCRSSIPSLNPVSVARKPGAPGMASPMRMTRWLGDDQVIGMSCGCGWIVAIADSRSRRLSPAAGRERRRACGRKSRHHSRAGSRRVESNQRRDDDPGSTARSAGTGCSRPPVSCGCRATIPGKRAAAPARPPPARPGAHALARVQRPHQRPGIDIRP